MADMSYTPVHRGAVRLRAYSAAGEAALLDLCDHPEEAGPVWYHVSPQGPTRARVYLRPECDVHDLTDALVRDFGLTLTMEAP